jgi:hypothetical protein
MRPGSVFVFLLMTAALLESGFRSAPSPVQPGGRIGTMSLVRGIEREADAELWGLFCDAVIPKPGRYRRTCSVPRVQRLFIGFGDWEKTQKALESAWKELSWDLWLDGRQVNLRGFGTSERTLYSFPAAGGKNVILREWSVILVGVTPGTHVIRYRSVSRSGGTTDASWALTVR